MERKYRLDTEENKAFLKELRKELLEFARNFPSPGGSAYYLKEDGTPWKEKDLETYETARMAHSYSIGEMLGFVGGKELAEKALTGLLGELKDTKNGGWYPGLHADGSCVPDKLCYAHAFVILAASTGLLIDSKKAGELLPQALEAYDRFFWNEEEGMACDTWNTEFTVLDEYRGLNANMHTVEAFLAAADCAGLELYRSRAGRIVDRVIGWASQNMWRIPEHYTSDWQPDLERNKEKPDDQFKPYGATPGHGLEWSRLIAQWACSTYAAQDPTIDQYIDAAEQLFCRAVTDAWKADGAPGIAYTTDWEGTPVVHDRMHWTLAEAINTSAVLYRVTGKQEYADRYAEFLQYLDENVLDHINGSWFHQLDQKNQVLDTVWPGKPDIYHALQAAIIPYAEVKLSVAVAVKEGKVRL